MDTNGEHESETVATRNISVYVAGSSEDLARARAFFERVRALEGAELAHDWAAEVEAHAHVKQEDLSDDERTEFAAADMQSIANCDAIVVLAECEPTGRGMWIELGYAMGIRDLLRDLPRLIVAGGGRRTIFTVPGMVDHECKDDDAAFAALVEFVAEVKDGEQEWGV